MNLISREEHLKRNLERNHCAKSVECVYRLNGGKCAIIIAKWSGNATETVTNMAVTSVLYCDAQGNFDASEDAEWFTYAYDIEAGLQWLQANLT